MKIAVEGCCHGELDKIYETVAHLEQKEGIKVDLLLCCGDFQAVRNPSDMRCMAVPPKYQRMNTFYKYYSGEKVAPILTVFIGGNHEASNYMQELPYGGWVAPNIYYMGYATVLNFRGVRIGGLSGIFKGKDFNRGHYERLPYTEDSKRSVYHIRNLEVFRLKQISRPVDIFLSHDWPTGVYNHGNVEALLKRKPFFREEIERNELGSPPAAEVLSKLKPSYWFAAHLHVKFAAIVDHNEDNKQTRFLSLDKCLPKRRFLQVVDIPHDPNQPAKLALDPEWLCILKSTNHLLSLSRGPTFMPGPGGEERYDFTVTDQEMRNLEQDFNGMFTIPENFVRTAAAYTPEPGTPRPKASAPPEIHVNEQTTLLCDMLELTDPNAVFTGANVSQVFDANVSLGNPAEISLDDEGDSDDDVPESSGYLSELSFTCSTPSQTPGTGKKRLLLPSPSNTSLDALELPPPVNTSLDADDTDASSGAALPAFKLDSMISCDSNDRDSGCSPSSRKHSDDIELSRDQSLLDDSVKDASLELLNSSASLDSSLNTSDLDASRSDIDPDVPSRKKFKRRNQSMYLATEDS